MNSVGPEQIIPRPPETRQGDPAPWADLPDAERAGIGVGRVLSAMEGARSTRRRLDGKPSAVLVAVFEEDSEARVILTRRAGNLRAHRGEISFPGGRIEPGEVPEDAAMREASEEIGLNPTSVSVIGRLSSISTFSSASAITPVVGLLPGRPSYLRNPAEVERVFDVSLAQLSDPEIFTEERWHRPERLQLPGLDGVDSEGWFPVWFFTLPADVVWGATARILVELLNLILGV